LVAADGDRREVTIMLNRVLHRELEAPFEAATTDPEDLRLLLTDPRVEPFLRTRRGLRVLRTFLAREAAIGAPELRRLDAAIAEESRAAASATRAYFLPEVSFEAALDNRLTAGGAGRASPVPAVPAPDGLGWSLGLRLSYPIFAGRARGAAKAEAAATLADLAVRRDAEGERVAARLRTAVLAAGASYAGVTLTREAADAAAENLELVSAAYRAGGATVTDLVDSQDAALAAQLGAMDATYDFLEDALRVERALGTFSFFATAADRAALLRRLERAAGGTGPP
jgi:outer membrane protein TolC